jgi:hypothetical protein
MAEHLASIASVLVSKRRSIGSPGDLVLSTFIFFVAFCPDYLAPRYPQYLRPSHSRNSKLGLGAETLLVFTKLREYLDGFSHLISHLFVYFPIMLSISAAAVFALATLTSAQTFQRLGACPSEYFLRFLYIRLTLAALGCILPPDQTDFLAGQYFDIRLEVGSCVNCQSKTNHARFTPL